MEVARVLHGGRYIWVYTDKKYYMSGDANQNIFITIYNGSAAPHRKGSSVNPVRPYSIRCKNTIPPSGIWACSFIFARPCAGIWSEIYFGLPVRNGRTFFLNGNFIIHDHLIINNWQRLLYSWGCKPSSLANQHNDSNAIHVRKLEFITSFLLLILGILSSLRDNILQEMLQWFTWLKSACTPITAGAVEFLFIPFDNR